MLPLVLCIIGGLAVLVAAFAAVFGGALVVFIPQLLAGGLLLLIGLAIERWRYKPVVRAHPDPGWSDTGERFVDPETGAMTAVYFDPDSGERHYLAQIEPARDPASPSR